MTFEKISADPAALQREIDKRKRYVDRYDKGLSLPAGFGATQYNQFKKDLNELRTLQAKFIYPEASSVTVEDSYYGNVTVNLPAQPTTQTTPTPQNTSSPNQNVASPAREPERASSQVNTENMQYVQMRNTGIRTGAQLAGQGTTPTTQGDLWMGAYPATPAAPAGVMRSDTWQSGPASLTRPLTATEALQSNKITGTLELTRSENIEKNTPEGRAAALLLGIGIGALNTGKDILPITSKGPGEISLKVPLAETAKGTVQAITQPVATVREIMKNPIEAIGETIGGSAILYGVTKIPEVPTVAKKITSIKNEIAIRRVPTQYPGDVPYVTTGPGGEIVIYDSQLKPGAPKQDVLVTQEGYVPIYPEYGLKRGGYDLAQRDLYGNPVPTSNKPAGVLPIETEPQSNLIELNFVRTRDNVGLTAKNVPGGQLGRGYEPSLAEGLSPSLPGYKNPPQAKISPDSIKALELQSGERLTLQTVGDKKVLVDQSGNLFAYQDGQYVLYTDDARLPRGFEQSRPSGEIAPTYGAVPDKSVQSVFGGPQAEIVLSDRSSLSIYKKTESSSIVTEPALSSPRAATITETVPSAESTSLTLDRPRVSTREVMQATAKTDPVLVEAVNYQMGKTIPVLNLERSPISSTSIRQDATQSQSFAPVTVQALDSSVRQDTAQIAAQGQAFKLNLSQELGNIQTQRKDQQLAQISTPALMQRVEQGQQQRQEIAQDSIAVPVPMTVASSTIRRYKSPGMTQPPKKPAIIPIVLPRASEEKGAVASVEVKRQGRFQVIASGIPVSEAVEIGKSIVQNTAARTFKITGPQDLSTDRISPEVFASKRDNIYVQRAKFAISSPGEKSEITRKGIIASRTKRGAGGVFA